MVDDDIQVAPGGKLSLPVANGREGNYHQKWTSDPCILLKQGEGGEGGREGGRESVSGRKIKGWRGEEGIERERWKECEELGGEK